MQGAAAGNHEHRRDGRALAVGDDPSVVPLAVAGEAQKPRMAGATSACQDIVVETLRDHRKAELELRFALGLGKLDPDALVFPETPDGGGPISPGAFSAEWRDVADAIGLTGITAAFLAPHPRVAAYRRRGRCGDDLQAPWPRLAGDYPENLRTPVPQGRWQGGRGDQCGVGEQEQNLIWGQLLPD
jgi:hypothetical protein